MLISSFKQQIACSYVKYYFEGEGKKHPPGMLLYVEGRVPIPKVVALALKMKPLFFQ